LPSGKCLMGKMISCFASSSRMTAKWPSSIRSSVPLIQSLPYASKALFFNGANFAFADAFYFIQFFDGFKRPLVDDGFGQRCPDAGNFLQFSSRCLIDIE